MENNNVIDRIVLHHSGGFLNDPDAPSQHLGLSDINQAHKTRWPDFPSELNPELYVGYNFLVFPGWWVQTRCIGEETAAQIGHNKDSVSFCLLGNFSKGANGQAVELPTQYQKDTLRDLILCLLSNRPDKFNIKVKSGTVLKLNCNSIMPHRALWPTACYGTALSDSYFKDIVKDNIGQRITLIRQLIDKYQQLLLALKTNAQVGAHYQVCCWEANNRG